MAGVSPADRVFPFGLNPRRLRSRSRRYFGEGGRGSLRKTFLQCPPKFPEGKGKGKK
jgi:hypothetical protein